MGRIVRVICRNAKARVAIHSHARSSGKKGAGRGDNRMDMEGEVEGKGVLSNLRGD